LWEAFLVQMNDFDRFLEFELRQMLDPVVASGAPRRRPRRKWRPLLTVVKAPLDLAVVAAVEPVAIPVSVLP
jgi:hypothetical protein